MILGTPRYMAPEQIRDASSAGPPGDIYSVGVIMYESLTGQSPYPAQDYGQLLGCVIEGRTIPLEDVRRDLPRGLGDVVRRAMDPDPRLRFGSADELAEAYGVAIGIPSRRKEIAARQPATRQRVRTRIPSQQAMLSSSKGGTLALDLSAALESLSDLPAGIDPRADPSRSMPGPSGTKPFPAPLDEISAAQHSQPLAQQPKGDTVMLPSTMEAPAYNPNYPASGMQSLGGVSQQQPMSMSMQSSSPYYPVVQQPYPSGPAAYAPPPKKKSRGLLLFLVAMVIVVVLSALGGFALKAYLKGDLDFTNVH
jgi:serine/threonine-protein kinase